MVAEQVLTYGLVDGHECQCDDSRMARGLCLDCCCAGSSRVDLATRDLDVYRVNAVVENLRQELGVCRDPCTIAEVELVKLRQSVPKSPPEPLVLRSGERWLVLEMPLEVDLSSRPRVPEFMVT